MKIVLDIEANSLKNPTKIYLVIGSDLDTGRLDIFRRVTEDDQERARCLEYLSKASLIFGHNLLGYDLPVLRDRLAYNPGREVRCLDGLILSKLIDYARPGGHSLAQYGSELGLEKIEFNDWTKWSQEMEDYCIRDVEISRKVYNLFLPYINDPSWHAAIVLEHEFQSIVNDLHTNGFFFDTKAATRLLDKVQSELGKLDKEIEDAFPPKLRLVREVHPRLTKYGTLNKSDFRFVKGGDLSEFNGGPFCRCEWEAFNPASHKQVIAVLNAAGWAPTDKTAASIAASREVRRLERSSKKEKGVDLVLQELYSKILKFEQTGWKINEANLNTLPAHAPKPARTLAKRILLESRRRTLTEWLGLVQDNSRIHGSFYGIGAWTHRMAHQAPNTANIPTEAKLYGGEMRALWRAPPKRLLVGVDAEGIQLRIFAHYVNDPELTQSLIDGRKENKTDPHSLNQRVLGSICKTRAAAKRFLYALLLGGGVGKFAEILDCGKDQAQEAVNLFIQRYPGFNKLRQERFPRDAKRGYFIGLDGRKVRIPGDNEGDRKHLAMSGYLQNGEAIIMKKAILRFYDQLKQNNSLLVNFVHDEWQVETPNNMETALLVAKGLADSLRIVGEQLKLNCPMAGSYWNDDRKDYTIGTNWLVTH